MEEEERAAQVKKESTEEDVSITLGQCLLAGLGAPCPDAEGPPSPWHCIAWPVAAALGGSDEYAGSGGDGAA